MIPCSKDFNVRKDYLIALRNYYAGQVLAAVFLDEKRMQLAESPDSEQEDRQETIAIRCFEMARAMVCEGELADDNFDI